MISEEMLEDWKKRGQKVTIPLSPEGEELQIKIFAFSGNQEEIPKKSCTKWFDYDKIKNGFCIRNRENGDFFISDTRGHHKKLKSYFIDEKIPSEQRDTMWLLAQENKVFWLVGGRISEDVKVSKETKTVIEIHYIGGN
jgi:tRNA(Ile)-lysidine synthase